MVIDLGVRLVRAGAMVAVGVAMLSSAVHAGCNCGKGGAVYGPAPMGPIYGGDAMHSNDFGAPPMMGIPMAAPTLIPTPDVAPPPGTLGQTYQRPMRPIPVDKHPRISIVDVRAPGATSVRVYGTYEYRTKDGFSGFQDRRDPSLWRMESEPLVPGIPHIYRVVAKYGDTAQEKYIRLVPGRIVTLDF